MPSSRRRQGAGRCCQRLPWRACLPLPVCCPAMQPELPPDPSVPPCPQPGEEPERVDWEGQRRQIDLAVQHNLKQGGWVGG